MAKLSDFFEKLASDEAFEAKYDADPEGTMVAFGLNRHQIDLVLTGTTKQIRKAIQDELPGKQVFVIRVKRG